eukprot:m.2935 g.2935  ORF g.2935 m.2935 type:complete len:194 (-) comp2626_c0_seq1:258-839(-)
MVNSGIVTMVREIYFTRSSANNEPTKEERAARTTEILESIVNKQKPKEKAKKKQIVKKKSSGLNKRSLAHRCAIATRRTLGGTRTLVRLANAPLRQTKTPLRNATNDQDDKLKTKSTSVRKIATSDCGKKKSDQNGRALSQRVATRRTLGGTRTSIRITKEMASPEPPALKKRRSSNFLMNLRPRSKRASTSI